MTSIDIRQAQTRTLQDQLNATATEAMDLTLASINNELTTPGRLIANVAPSLVVTVGSGVVANPNTSKNRVLPQINNQPVSFTGGTITFPANASGNITPNPGSSTPMGLSITQISYIPVLVQLSVSGLLQLTVGAASTSLGTVVIPDGNPSYLSLGYIVVQTDASGNIQNITNSMLYQYIGVNLGPPSLVPSGVILPYGGSAAPSGYLMCNGAAVSRTFYASLYAAIGTSFGIGDGSTTFNLPNMARAVPMGAGGTGTSTIGNTVGSQGGEENHVLIDGEMAEHNHGGATFASTSHYHQLPITQDLGRNQYVIGEIFGSSSHNATYPADGCVTQNLQGTEQPETIVSNSNTPSSSTTLAIDGNNIPHNNIQPSVIVNYIISM